MEEEKKDTGSSAGEIKEEVRKHYGGAITGKKGTSCCSPGPQERIISLAELAGYGDKERSQVPEEAYNSSFGCGNPLMFTDVKPGDVVLDLGSGAGLDVLLASKKVGPTGKVIGLDMTPEMIEKATENASKAGAENVEFKYGEMEDMPVEDGSVDWIISNCVINLSPDKKKVFQEAFRVLKPGGKIVVSDIVAEGIPEDLRDLLWASCVGGAVDEATYLTMIRDAGFEDVHILGRLDYDREMISGLLGSGCLDLPKEVRRVIDERGENWNTKISSLKVSARKKITS
ncbi:MAG: Methyltransferase type 11 [Deltaproteobacteria bacterium]|nr:Methyltransferase type 11 [Deltaproteobacteria bacterium]